MVTPNKILFWGAAALAFVATTSASAFPDDLSVIDDMARNEEVAYRLKMAIKVAKEIEFGPLQQAVQTKFLDTLTVLGNASDIAGTNVSEAAGTVISGFAQGSFNFGSIGAYIPRLIFLDPPTQFIEVLRLIKTDKIKVPADIESAMDTLTNFATEVRDAPTFPANTPNPFLAFFPNIFRGSEMLAGDVLFGVFSWLAPLSPDDVEIPSMEKIVI